MAPSGGETIRDEDPVSDICFQIKGKTQQIYVKSEVKTTRNTKSSMSSQEKGLLHDRIDFLLQPLPEVNEPEIKARSHITASQKERHE